MSRSHAFLGDVRAFRSEKMGRASIFDCPQLFLDVYCLEPGQEQKPHTHDGAAKIYYVIDGRATFTVGADVMELDSGHAVLARAGELHGVRNDSPEEARLIVVMAPNPNRADGKA